MSIHPWWNTFGNYIETLEEHWSAARQILVALATGPPGAAIREIRYDADWGLVGFMVEIDVERPQDLAFPIRGIEPIAILVKTEQMVQPTILALREGFPDTPHQNLVPDGMPPALCIDDRPWSEAVLNWTAIDTVRRIQQWLAKAARGELHDAVRPLDPLFFPAPQSIVISRAALLQTDRRAVELVGFVHAENSRVIVTRKPDEVGSAGDKGRLIVAVVRSSEKSMEKMRQAPTTLDNLAKELDGSGVGLVEVLRNQIVAWAGLDRDGVRRLGSMLAIVVEFPVRGPEGQTANDLRAFVTVCTAGDVGVALGALYRNESGKGAKEGFVRAMPVGLSQMESVQIEPCEVHLAFDAKLGAIMAGREPDCRQVVLVGAGSLGSQLAVNLAREGAFHWTVVDGDYLLPHNIARHALTQSDVGLPKAMALARHMEPLVDAPVAFFCCDVGTSGTTDDKDLQAALTSAEVIIDTTASVSAARHLSDVGGSARRISVFFNPSGTDVVVLTEAADRCVTLRDLEAQYHALLLSEPDLETHLAADTSSIRYSGSCRALTNRIAASSAALLSALGSRGVRMGLQESEASIRIWSVKSNGVTRLFERNGRVTKRVRIGGWDLAYDASMLDEMSVMRASGLPSETGGVLVGIADMRRRSIHLIAALPPPPDSSESPIAFERGIEGLSNVLNAISETTMHYVRYIGEWHSHPVCASTMPSTTDLQQIAWLRQELSVEGLPALMAIVGDDGRFSFILSDDVDSS